MNAHLHWRIIETGLGKFIVLKADTGLLWLDVDEPKARAYSQKTLAKYVDFKDDARAFALETSGVALQLQEYVEGKRKAFSLDLELVGTPFQKSVWRALLEIPYGKTVSYQDIAKKLGRPKASRAVAKAVGANPFLILIPCHRVIGSDGNLRGFRAGLELKKKLLALEGVRL
jgi:O-6-methylguanine DNA methyltransferase